MGSGEVSRGEGNSTSDKLSTREMVRLCISCQWKKCEQAGQLPEVSASQIRQCRGIGTEANHHLKRLEKQGAVTSNESDMATFEGGGPFVNKYRPSDSPAGQEFRNNLPPPPDVCGLDQPPST